MRKWRPWIFLYTLNDLEQSLCGSFAKGRCVHGMEIIDNEVALLQRELERDAAPLVTDLRAHFESVHKVLNEAQNISAEEATRRLLNRLLLVLSKRCGGIYPLYHIIGGNGSE